VGVFFLMLDGVGLGRPGGSNPVSAGLPSLSRILGVPLDRSGFQSGEIRASRAVAYSLDARLGVEGIPQSATGQTSIFCGINAASILGRHENSHPGSHLTGLIEGGNLFHDGKRRGKTTFLNAYRPEAFSRMEQGTYTPSATTVAAKAAGIPLRSFAQLDRGEALYHDITHWTLRLKQPDFPERQPVEAGKIALSVMREHLFTVFEYFVTDIAGHRQDEKLARYVLSVLDQFLLIVIGGILSEDYLVITADHGNLEDLSTPAHTLNDVFLVVISGKEIPEIPRPRDLSHVRQLVGRLMEVAS